MKFSVLTALLSASAMVAGASAADPKPAPAKKNAPAASAAAPAKKDAPTKEAAPKGAPAPDAPAKEAAEFAPKDPVAVVNGMDVTVADLEKVITALVSEKGGSIKDVPPDMKPKLYRQVLDGVIVEKLVTVRRARSK